MKPARAQPGLPPHLRLDAQFVRCDTCGRKTWAKGEWGKRCKMLQPDGSKCRGKFPVDHERVDDKTAGRSLHALSRLLHGRETTPEEDIAFLRSVVVRERVDCCTTGDCLVCHARAFLCRRAPEPD